ncbi:MAG: IclR family transcriptional regulator [Novosphingobium sp.]
MAQDDEGGAVGGTRYRAPALEKGLDVLELLVAEGRAMTMTDICQHLGRSQGEMFRMVQVLQSRGFVDQDRASDGYVLTGKLFSMAMRQPPVRSLVEIALPEMRKLAMGIGQSCHLAVHSQGQIVVVARVESDEQIGFSVRVGHHRPMQETVSGAVLLGFQPPELRARWLGMMPHAVTVAQRDAFLARSNDARKAGYASEASTFTVGITDVSAPVLRGDRAAAALTVPFIRHANPRCELDEVIERLIAAARRISGGLVESDNRI